VAAAGNAEALTQQQRRRKLLTKITAPTRFVCILMDHAERGEGGGQSVCRSERTIAVTDIREKRKNLEIVEQGYGLAGLYQNGQGGISKRGSKKSTMGGRSPNQKTT